METLLIIRPILSVSITMLILLAFWRLAKRETNAEKPELQVFSGDVHFPVLLNPKLFRWASWITESPFVFGTAMWITISILLSVVFPLLEKPEFFKHTDALIITLEYTLFVPLLYGSYLFLGMAIIKLLNPKSLLAFGVITNKEEATKYIERISRRWWKRSLPWILISLTVGIQLVVMYNRLKKGKSYDAWIMDMGQIRVFTVSGTFYYILRGINAYLALNCFVLIRRFIVIIHNNFYSKECKTHLLSDELHPGPCKEISNVTTALLSCLLFASLAIALHAVPNFLSRNDLQQMALTGIVSTWVLWFILTLIGAIGIYSCIRRFYELLEKEKICKMEEIVTEIKARCAKAPNKGMAELLQARDYADQICISPLGRKDKIAIFSFATLQLSNVIGLVVTIKALVI